MIRSTAVRCAGLSLALAGLVVHSASAQLTEIDYSDWNPALTGNQNWQVDANWSTPTFPNDPGRVDLDPVNIQNVVGANVSVALGADLNLNVGATDVTVAALKLGGTAGPVKTTIVGGSGGRLVFENYELNDETDPDNIIPSFNFGNALITSGGVAGSVNEITAPIHLNNENLGIAAASTNDLIIRGSITYATSGAIRSFQPAGTQLVIESDIAILADQPFGFNNAAAAGGTIVLNGVISGTPTPGQVNPQVIEFGSSANDAAVGTIVFNKANTTSIRIELERGNFVLANNAAFGTGTIKPGQQDNFGINLISTSDDRVISNEMSLAQYVTIKGEHSLTWAGNVSQGNSRGWMNLLPAGKTFTLSGRIGADSDPPESPAQNNRIMYFDGTGETIISGSMENRIDTQTDQPQSFGVRGSGTVRVTGTNNIYTAYTYVRGGNLHYATNASLAPAPFRSLGGAVGVDTGTVFVGGNPANVNTTFLSKFSNRASATPSPQGDLVTFDEFDSGALMLTPAEASANINFTAATISNAADMSLAGPAGGITYTGTVTPANSTYRFGGGAGVITLPGTNQLTGANGLVATNGLDRNGVNGLGGVRITGVNNYTGPTRVVGKFLTSNTFSAIADSGPLQAGAVYNGTTLTVTSLANGGANSSIGASSSAASNLVLQGSTLRYEGGTTSTNRLFTIGTHGATLDASGTGPVSFTNTGALEIDTAEVRSGVTSGLAFGRETGVTEASTVTAYNIADTSDIVPGMRISGQFLTESPSDNDTTITVTAIQSPTRIVFSDPIGLFTNAAGTATPLTFIDVERTFTLTGNNTGNNTLAPIIGDSPTNVVNVAKSGAGKWVLTGANTYTGDTSIEDGILSITNAYLADTADVLIDGSGVFDLNFGGADTIRALYLNGASQRTGTYGSLASSATYKSPYFTGLGVLNVTSTVLTAIPGDYNNDGIVDAADYTVYRDNVGQPDGTLLNDPIGGTVGAAQYTQWATNYGLDAPPASTSLAVPEPAAVMLAGIAAAACLMRRKAA